MIDTIFTHKLTPAALERLAILNEECGEVVQLVSKILRHGADSYNPSDLTMRTNTELLAEEIGHILNAINMLTRNNDVSATEIEQSRAHKAANIHRFLHHQPTDT